MSEVNIVLVDDLASLENYYNRLSTLKEEVRTRGQKLMALADEVSSKAITMASITSAQNNNWQDPQYETLKDAVTPCVQALKSNAAMMKETTATIETTLAQVDFSLNYLRAQIEKIKNI